MTALVPPVGVGFAFILSGAFLSRALNPSQYSG